MSAAAADAPTPFTQDDYLARMRRAVGDATRAGLDGLLVMPGPDLVWLTGYRPTAITERLTILVLTPGKRPALLVPVLERPDAEAAEGAPSLEIMGWSDATDPYQVTRDLLHQEGRFGVSDSTWAMHLLGLQHVL